MDLPERPLIEFAILRWCKPHPGVWNADDFLLSATEEAEENFVDLDYCYRVQINYGDPPEGRVKQSAKERIIKLIRHPTLSAWNCLARESPTAAQD
jgi:hypothetical protein